MRFQDIQKMAKGMDIKPYRMKKTEMIRAIQRQENNIQCYGTHRVDTCEEESCLWRVDCLTLNNK